MTATKFCPHCNGEINIDATRCKHCKKWLNETSNKPKNFLETMLLCYFLGAMGIHRFYTGYYVIGIIQLLTIGGCGIWSLIDTISICVNSYKDSNGIPLNNYNKKVGLIILFIILLCITLLIALFLFAIYLLAISSGVQN